MPFYFSKDILGFLVTRNYFLICEKIEEDGQINERVSLINKLSGDIERYFNVKCFNRWIVYMDKFLLLCEIYKNEIYCYTFDGDLIEKTEICKNKFIVNLQFSDKKQLYFLREKDDFKVYHF